MNIAEILVLKYPEQIANRQILIQDDGNGPYIKEWNMDIPKPTKEELSKWELEVTDEYERNQVLIKRQQAYPPIENLIVALWERLVEGKADATDELQAVREQVKAENPLPDEALATTSTVSQAE